MCYAVFIIFGVYFVVDDDDGLSLFVDVEVFVLFVVASGGLVVVLVLGLLIVLVLFLLLVLLLLVLLLVVKDGEFFITLGVDDFLPLYYVVGAFAIYGRRFEDEEDSLLSSSPLF